MKRTIFATGADIKNKFLFARGKEVYPGPDIGDLSDAENFEKFKKEAHRLAKDKKVKPGIVAYDLHPGYFSTKFAKEKHSWLAKKYKLVPVQHHHAHIASVMCEFCLGMACAAWSVYRVFCIKKIRIINYKCLHL